MITSMIEDFINRYELNNSLLNNRFIHSSSNKKCNYDRDEFLGSAFLNLAAAHLLCTKYPDKSAEHLTALRSIYVNISRLHKISLKIGLDKYVDAHTNVKYNSKKIYADILEAFIGRLPPEYIYKFVNEYILDESIVPIVYPNNDPISKVKELFDEQGLINEFDRFVCTEVHQDNSSNPEHGFIYKYKQYSTSKYKSKKDAKRELCKLILQQTILI